MTRTYARSGSTASSKSRPKVKGGGGWRSQAVFDDSLQSPPGLFDDHDQGSRRKPLKTLGNPSLFSPDSEFGLTHNDEDSNDPFDRLCSGMKKMKVKNKKETLDPFDMILEGGSMVDSERPKPINRILEDVGNCFSSPEVNEDKENSRDLSCKLFSSFTKEDECDLKFKPLKVLDNKTPRVRRPKSYRGRTKKSSVAIKMAPEPSSKPALNETLETKLTFRSESSLVDQSVVTGSGFGRAPLPVSSMTSTSHLSPAGFCRMNQSRSLKTSTPILLKKSSCQSIRGLSIKGDLVDDVFSPNPGSPSVRKPDERTKTKTNSEDSVTSIDPTPLKDFVQVGRGKTQFTGQARSVMRHYNYQPSLVTALPSISQLPPGSSSSPPANSSPQEGSGITSLAEENGGDIHEDSVFEASPVKMMLTTSRGRREFTGPAKSIMNHYGYHPSLVTLPRVELESASCSEADLDMPSAEVVYEEIAEDEEEPEDVGDEEEEEDESVYMNCVCDVNVTTSDWVIQCDYCQCGFHVACVNLDEKDIEDLEKTNMAWSCPRCIEAAASEDKDPGSSSDIQEISGGENHVESECGVIEQTEVSLAGESSLQVSQAVSVELLSVTAHLEALHKVNCEDQEDSWMFSKPMPPPAKKVVEVELEIKPGKSWRRSMSNARKTNALNIEEINRKWSIDMKKPPKMTPVKSRSSRSSFIVVPATPQRTAKKSVMPSVPNLFEELDEETEEDVEYPPPTNMESHLSKLLNLCTNKTAVDIEDIYSSQVLKSSIKVGEGAFGEVFLINSCEENKPVLKVVPIGGDLEVNGEEQTSHEDILSEVMISSHLSNLRHDKTNQTSGFVELRSCNVFQGLYPAPLLDLWDKFDEEKESENDRPDFFPLEQQYIALEYGNGGKDLEKFVFKHPGQALKAWLQVAHSLAVAESHMGFEHRDLHWGNVLIKETKDKMAQFRLNGDLYEVDTEGVTTNIIDFSLSRLTTDGVTIFSDKTTDPTLFTAKGKDKPGGDYQFDIYRMMKAHNKEDWESFSPKTNIFWLHYMLDKMVDGVYYAKSCKKTTKVYKTGMKGLKDLKERLLSDFNSASDFVRREGKRKDN